MVGHGKGETGTNSSNRSNQMFCYCTCERSVLSSRGVGLLNLTVTNDSIQACESPHFAELTSICSNAMS